MSIQISDTTRWESQKIMNQAKSQFLKNPLLKLHEMRDTLQINEWIFAKDGLSEIANNLQPNQIP